MNGNPFNHPLMGNMARLVRLIRQNPEQAKALANDFASQGILPPFADQDDLLKQIEPFAKNSSNVSQRNQAVDNATNPQGGMGAAPVMPTPDQLAATLMGRPPNG